MSLIGKEINGFSTQTFQNSSFRAVSREGLCGEWSVFFFYPTDFAFACPTKLKDPENSYTAFQGVDCGTYSVSCDAYSVHKIWHNRSEKTSKIIYPMLADPTQALVRDFEVLTPGTDLAGRDTFIVNSDLKVVACEINTGSVGRNAEGLFRKVQACQSVHEHGDEVCLAKWALSAETPRSNLDLVGVL